MTRLLTVQTQMHDPHALRQTCRHLGLPPPLLSEWSLAEEQFVAFLLFLPGWSPVLLDTLTGLLRCLASTQDQDLKSCLAPFLRAYTDQKARRDACLNLNSLALNPLVEQVN